MVIRAAAWSWVVAILLLTLISMSPLTVRAGDIRVRVGVANSLELQADEPFQVEKEGSWHNAGSTVHLKQCGSDVCAAGIRARSILLQTESAYLNWNAHRYPSRIRVIRDGGKLALIASLSVEVYLLGVLGREMSPTWPLAALQAQAVVARTFAWRRIRKNSRALWDVQADTSDQMFTWGMAVGDAIREAVRSTEGWIMTVDGDPIDGFFHADCGGHSADAQEVWGRASPGIEGVADSWCVAANRGHWSYRLRPAEDGAKLGTGTIRSMHIRKTSSSGRVAELVVTGKGTTKVFSGENLRRELGYTTIKSALFTIQNDRGVVINGSGYGHGLGLCQNGARGQAEAGRSWQEILDFYFPSTLLVPAE